MALSYKRMEYLVQIKRIYVIIDNKTF